MFCPYQECQQITQVILHTAKSEETKSPNSEDQKWFTLPKPSEVNLCLLLALAGQLAVVLVLTSKDTGRTELGTHPTPSHVQWPSS